MNENPRGVVPPPEILSEIAVEAMLAKLRAAVWTPEQPIEEARYGR